ncbi:MAG: hypothetical protein ACOCQW_05230 [Halanaerobiaceae bacterium]
MKKRFIIFVSLIILVMVVSTGFNDKILADSQDTYTVSGRVVLNNSDDNGIEGVTINIGKFGSVTTDSEGYWSKSGISGRVTVTPEKGDMIFRPEFYTLTNPEYINFNGSINVNCSINITSSSAYCKFNSINGDTREDFDDIEIIVDGKAMELTHYDTYRLDGLDLKTGDDVKVEINNTILGKTEYNLIVPPSVKTITSRPQKLDNWVNGNFETITIEWDEVDCTAYRTSIIYYDNYPSIQSWSTLSNNDSKTYNQFDLLYDEEKNEKIGFSVTAVNISYLIGFYGGSNIEVEAVNTPQISNYNPEEN